MTVPEPLQAKDIFPDTAKVVNNHLTLGGCDVVSLAEKYGTPLYIFDEATLLSRMSSYKKALEVYPGKSLACYAAKAYCAPWLLRIVEREGFGLDVVSGGELYTGIAVNFPRERMYFHGNNKGEDELELAVREGVGRIIIDNLDEVALLAKVAKRLGKKQAVLLRVGPGVDPHTHAHIATGGLDTKFGLGVASGAAEDGLKAILAHPGELDLRGLHAHIGSQIHETEFWEQAVDRVFAFAKAMKDKHGLNLREMSPGGGFGVRYTTEDPEIHAKDMIAEVAGFMTAAAKKYGFDEPFPDLTIEPGRSTIASTAVAVYEVGAVKTIPDIRTYVSVDGGMADNIRPTAYGAKYSSVLANRVEDGPLTTVAVAGKYCESGDVLIREAKLPMPKAGDLVAIPTAGAYHLAMASNYNMATKPAVVVVADGRERLVRRRETYQDLLVAEVIEEPARV